MIIHVIPRYIYFTLLLDREQRAERVVSYKLCAMEWTDNEARRHVCVPVKDTHGIDRLRGYRPDKVVIHEFEQWAWLHTLGVDVYSMFRSRFPSLVIELADEPQHPLTASSDDAIVPHHEDSNGSSNWS